MTPIDTDAVVVGAGPVGLFQVFQLGLQGISAHLVDALPQPGGQCMELYPDKPIYDIPGLPLCSGRELTARLLQQIAPFHTPQHLAQQVLGLQAQADGRWLLQTDAGTAFLARTVFIAAGVGAFVPRRLAVAGLEAFEGRQLFHHAPPEQALVGQRVVVVGGEDPALDCALQCLADGRCASVTLVHRNDKFKASANLEAAVRSALADGRLRFVAGQPVGWQGQACTGLTALEVATADDHTLNLPLDTLLPRLGLSPKLGPIADWGLAMERKLLQVSPESFATSAPGIYAVGDINHYPGKRKLIVCGFHEATLAAFAAAAHLRPHERQLLQYTTTSPRLHALLGVAPVQG